MFKISSCIGVAVVALSACVPVPNVRYYAPAVTGKVMANGLAVRNAEVIVTSQFAEEVRKVATDSEGHFSTEAIKKLFFTATLIGDPLYGYTITIVVADQKYEGLSEAYVGHPPKQLDIQCDLSTPIQLHSRKRYCNITGSKDG